MKKQINNTISMKSLHLLLPSKYKNLSIQFRCYLYYSLFAGYESLGKCHIGAWSEMLSAGELGSATCTVIGIVSSRALSVARTSW